MQFSDVGLSISCLHGACGAEGVMFESEIPQCLPQHAAHFAEPARSLRKRSKIRPYHPHLLKSLQRSSARAAKLFLKP